MKNTVQVPLENCRRVVKWNDVYWIFIGSSCQRDERDVNESLETLSDPQLTAFTSYKHLYLCVYRSERATSRADRAKLSVG